MDIGVDSRLGGAPNARLADCLAERLPGSRPPFLLLPLPGGYSNITYEVRDSASGRWVLRRPPSAGVLETAHDVGREYMILSALRSTAVPVPATVFHQADPEPFGTPFYVMQYVDGQVLRSPIQMEAHLALGARRRLGEQVIGRLLAIHAVDVASVGLHVPDGAYLGRQLRRWSRQIAASPSPRTGGLIRTGQALARAMPRQQAITLVHGDYRIDNLIVSADGDVAAVLDWELSTIGDPLADLGTYIAYATPVSDAARAFLDAPAAAPGFPSIDELTERYRRGSGLDLTALDYYRAFGHWKLACIVEGVYDRAVRGARDGGGPERVAATAAFIEEHAASAVAIIGAG